MIESENFISDIRNILTQYVGEINNAFTRGSISTDIHHYLNSKISVMDLTSISDIDKNIIRFRITDFTERLIEISMGPGETIDNPIIYLDVVIED